MEVSLYQFTNEPNAVVKQLSDVIAHYDSVRLKDETSVQNPIFTISDQLLPQVRKANYLFCPNLWRYYFINEMVSVRTHLWELRCHVDVLMSFRNELMKLTAVVARNEHNYNLYLDDSGTLRCYQNPIFQTKQFPQTFGEPHLILTVNGGASV